MRPGPETHPRPGLGQGLVERLVVPAAAPVLRALEQHIQKDCPRHLPRQWRLHRRLLQPGRQPEGGRLHGGGLYPSLTSTSYSLARASRLEVLGSAVPFSHLLTAWRLTPRASATRRRPPRLPECRPDPRLHGGELRHRGPPFPQWRDLLRHLPRQWRLHRRLLQPCH